MNILIKNYIDKMTISNILEFAFKNDISLSKEESEFIYNFIKKNWQIIIDNPNSFDLDKFKDKFSDENYIKIKELYTKYSEKYLK